MNLSKIVSQSKMKTSRGFTLIELLIVIAILGVLAAGLLATLDPIEQIRRSRDTNRRSQITEFTQALNRYYANAGQYPWGSAATGSTDLTSTQGQAVLATLTTANELKTSFAAAVETGQPMVFYSDASQNVYGCTRQESRAPNQVNIYTNTGTPPTTGATCSGTSGGTSCWFCAR